MQRSADRRVLNEVSFAERQYMEKIGRRWGPFYRAELTSRVAQGLKHIKLLYIRHPTTGCPSILSNSLGAMSSAAG